MTTDTGESDTGRTTVRVLVADDEESMRFFVRRGLRRHGYEVDAFESGADAVAAFDARPFDVVVVDLKMPGIDGMQVLEHVRTADPDAAVVMMTGHGSIQTAVEAMRKGAFDFVTKPFELDELALSVERALALRAALRENRSLRSLVDARTSFGGLVGQSPALRVVFESIERLRGSDATVLITGESGTGKELVARAIHANSARSGGPFVTVQCAAVPVQLVESELFGHVAGAFTGAVKQRRGLLEKADGGTLFLDEVADMPLGAQAKVERALQEREIVPLGDSQPRKIDIRIVAATNRDVEQAVREGLVRQELFWRLNVVPIHLPPLRDRREDVPVLVDCFLRRSAERLGVPVKSMSLEAMVMLSRQPWPGNVRELQNAVERLAVLHPDVEELGVEDLPEPMRGDVGAAAVDAAAIGQLPFADAMRAFERDYLERLFDRTHGNITEAARLAGVSRGHLHRKARQVGVEAEQFRHGGGRA